MNPPKTSYGGEQTQGPTLNNIQVVFTADIELHRGCIDVELGRIEVELCSRSSVFNAALSGGHMAQPYIVLAMLRCGIRPGPPPGLSTGTFSNAS